MNTSVSLENKRVVVTGASSGLGLAVTRQLVYQNARAFLISRNEEDLRGLSEKLMASGTPPQFYPADVSQFAEVSAAFHEAEDTMGGIDILIHCAGLPGGSIFSSSPEDWRYVLETNLLGSMHCSYLAVESMRRHRIPGHIVMIGSLIIRLREAGADVYVASKTGLDGFAESLRREVAKDSIAVTLVNPGLMASDMIDESPQEKTEGIRNQEMLSTDDVARIILTCVAQPARAVITEIEVRPREQLNL